MAQAEIPLAILFADLGESTRLYDTLGDVRAHRIAARYLERIREVVEKHGGRVIKTIGDEVMSTFSTAAQATRAACAIQQGMEDATRAERVHIGVHVGLHFGPVLPEAGDVFGDAVNVAARMVGLAKAGQILTTRETVEALGDDAREQTRRIDRRPVKGKHQELEIYEVIWQAAGLTALIQVPTAGPDGRDAQLTVRVGEHRFHVGGAQPTLTIGRDPDNDLVLQDPRVSRRHARIELRQGKFVLYDASTNGTVVRTRAGQRIYLRREELILSEPGSIGIGEHDADGEHPIRFEFGPGQEAQARDP